MPLIVRTQNAGAGDRRLERSSRDETRRSADFGEDAQSRVVRLDPDLKEEADKSREDAS